MSVQVSFEAFRIMVAKSRSLRISSESVRVVSNNALFVFWLYSVRMYNTDTGPMATKDMPKVNRTTFCKRLRKLLSLQRFCSLGRDSQTMRRKGNDRPKKNTANGAVFCEKLLVGVLMTTALLSPSMMA